MAISYKGLAEQMLEGTFREETVYGRRNRRKEYTLKYMIGYWIQVGQDVLMSSPFTDEDFEDYYNEELPDEPNFSVEVGSEDSPYDFIVALSVDSFDIFYTNRKKEEILSDATLKSESSRGMVVFEGRGYQELCRVLYLLGVSREMDDLDNEYPLF